jgi:hypothetical protein
MPLEGTPEGGKGRNRLFFPKNVLETLKSVLVLSKRTFKSGEKIGAFIA